MEQKIKTLQTLHLAICAGAICAFVFTGNLSIDRLMIKSIETSELVYVAIPILAFFLGNFLFRMQLKQSNPKSKLEDNIAIYQTASLIRWAILEGAAFLILFMKPSFIILGILIIAYLIYLRPTESRMANDLQSIN